MAERPVDSKEVGLVAGLYVLEYFVGAHDLHYGLWRDDIPLDVRNIARAQDAYSEYLISHIPADASRILDVGMGAGNLSRRLLDRGYEVEGVSPSPLLSKRAREVLGPDYRIHAGRFEDVDVAGPFDLVLFSESYQYIDLPTTFEKSLTLLAPGGHLLICDFFQLDVPGKSIIGGGHGLAAFYRQLDRQPYATVVDEDITALTAPNLDLVNDMSERLLRPLIELGVEAMQSRRPQLLKLLRWRFRRKLDKLRRKYVSGERNAESFARHKSYRLLLLQRSDVAG